MRLIIEEQKSLWIKIPDSSLRPWIGYHAIKVSVRGMEARPRLSFPKKDVDVETSSRNIFSDGTSRKCPPSPA